MCEKLNENGKTTLLGAPGPAVTTELEKLWKTAFRQQCTRGEDPPHSPRAGSWPPAFAHSFVAQPLGAAAVTMTNSPGTR